MTQLTWRLARGVIAAAALTALSVGLAYARPATVGTNTNLRQGPGTTFPVITTVPAGSVVEVIRCGADWCNVTAGGQPGYMVARNLGLGGPGPVRVVGAPPPPVVVVEPPPVYYGYGPYYGPRLYYGPGFYYGPRRHWRRW